MTQVTDRAPSEAVAPADLGEAVLGVLRASSEPMTVSKIRAQLPAALRSISVEQLGEHLLRQAQASAIVEFPKYRSQQIRFWDRPMSVHVAALLRSTVEERAMAWPELRRKLPAYAAPQAESVLQDLVARGELHRHPNVGRGGDRYGARPADPTTYLRPELTDVFQRLETLGFTPAQLRAGALELLHEEEWAAPESQTPKAEAESTPESAASTPADPNSSTAARPGNPLAGETAENPGSEEG
jgi:hypothetical protein